MAIETHTYAETSENIDAFITQYWNAHKDELMDDIRAMIACQSDTDATEALNCVLGISRRLGFETFNDSNLIGWADIDFTNAGTFGRDSGESTGGSVGADSHADSCTNSGMDSCADMRTDFESDCADQDSESELTSRINEGAPYYALIGHTDTVPAGPGWNSDPFTLTEREGYLLGRGISDDKGPVVVALYALAAARAFATHATSASEAASGGSNVIDRSRVSGDPVTLDGSDTLDNSNAPLPWRFLFGTCEETSMDDAKYYVSHYPQPTFLFSPDAEFPVSYGEKGILHAHLVSEPFVSPTITSIEAGAVLNAVPGTASMEITFGLPGTSAYGTDTLTFNGKQAHASTPEKGINAIAMLVDYIFDNDLCNAAERRFFRMVERIVNDPYGHGVGIESSDEDFGCLTIVGSTLAIKPYVPLAQNNEEITGNPNDSKGLEGSKMVPAFQLELGIDVRMPTTYNGETMTAALEKFAAEFNASLHVKLIKEPFLTDPHSVYIEALQNAYDDVVGGKCEPFTMAGGTYARVFENAVSFGMEEPALVDAYPDWVGGMHAPNEGVAASELERAFDIYTRSIVNLSRIIPNR